MDESMGAQYALQVALDTLKLRCQQFQQRIAVLEEENINLRLQNDKNDEQEVSLSEVDTLKERIAKLTQQKSQLRSNIQIVSAENQRLWSKLIQITKAKDTLDSHLIKINDSLSQHSSNTKTKAIVHAPVLRSKTFTLDEPHTKIIQKNVIEEDSLCLEDISLKLINNLVKEKSELELQCSQMAEIQNSDVLTTSSYGFAYPDDDVEEATFEEFERILNELKTVKESLVQERELLQNNLINLSKFEGISKCKKCDKECKENSSQTVFVQKTNHEEEEMARELASLANWGTPSNSGNYPENKTKPIETDASQLEVEKICPLCSKHFPIFIEFQEFQAHVESHFIQEDNPIGNFELL